MTRRRPHAVLVVVLLSATAIALSIAHGSRSPSPARPAPTRASAVRAAVAALYELSVPAVLSRARFDEAVRRLAAPGARRRLEATFGAAQPVLASAFRRSPRVLRGAPLGYRVERFSLRAARVAIWSVAIAGSPDFEPEAQWRTLAIDLVWTRGGWRVGGGSGVAGPDPSTPVRELATQASSFRSLTHVP
jgi:hypothetical protein